MQPVVMPISIAIGKGCIISIAADTQRLIRVYVTAAPDAEAARADRTAITIMAQDPASGESARVDTTFNGDPR